MQRAATVVVAQDGKDRVDRGQGAGDGAYEEFVLGAMNL